MQRPTRIWTACAALGALVACRDSASEPMPAGAIEVQRTALELELGDSALVGATVRDASGRALSGRTVAWSSSDASVARVSGAGMITGVAPGSATVTASVEGRSATVGVTVLPYNIAANVVVVDSALLRMVSDSTQRAAGTFRFQVLSGSTPTWQPGVIIVGSQWPGFLRRITAATIQGSTIVAQTTAAALSDVIEVGSFQTRIGLLSSSATVRSSALRPGQVAWGAPVLTYLAPGVRATAAGFDLSGLDVCEILAVGSAKGGAKCPSGIEKLQIKTGFLDFDPDLDFQATFSGFDLQTFRGVFDGTLDLRFTGLLEAEASATLAEPFKILDLTRAFWFQIGAIPVVGYVDLTLNAGLEIKATAKGSIEAGFTNLHTVQVGATYSKGAGWAPVFQSTRTFTGTEPSIKEGTLTAQVDLDSKLSFKPEFKIIFYGVIGPFANVEPYGQATLTFGTQSCGLDSKAAVDSEIGFTIPFLDESVSDFAQQQTLGSWAGATWNCPLGALDVTTSTSGSNQDPDGYTVVVDSTNKGSVGTSSSLSLPQVEVGTRKVWLEGVAPNCTVQGPQPQSVSVVLGGAHSVSFSIQCAATTGDLEVSVQTSGVHLDPDGYTATINGAQAKALAINGMTSWPGLAQGTYTVALAGVAGNCAVSGANPRSVTVAAGAPTRVTFQVYCSGAPLVVSVPTSGPPATSADWTLVLDGQDTQAVPPNGTATFTVSPGSHRVELRDVASNCTVQGANPQVVQVSGTAQVAVTFQVTCVGGGLTVSVATTGDATPAVTFTIRVGTTTQLVSVNGSVTFSNLAQGTHSVGLEGFPSHCVVTGLNPRSVASPGSTTFSVICQKLPSCGTPPSGFYLKDTTWIARENNSSPGTLTTQIVTSDWTNHSVSASATAMAGAHTDIIHAASESFDFINVIPVNPALVDTRARVLARVKGLLQVTGDTTSGYRAWAYAGLSTYDDVYGWQLFANTPNPMINAFDQTVQLSVTLGKWQVIRSEAIASAEARNGNTNTGKGSVKIENLVDVRDAGGNLIPVLRMCTASGKVY